MEINQPKANISENGMVVVGTFLSLVYLGLMLSSFGAFFKPLSDEFGWTRGDTSGAFSTAMIMSGLMAIVAGRMADKFSPRLVIIICGVLMGCAFLLLSQMHDLYQLFIYCVEMIRNNHTYFSIISISCLIINIMRREINSTKFIKFRSLQLLVEVYGIM